MPSSTSLESRALYVILVSCLNDADLSISTKSFGNASWHCSSDSPWFKASRSATNSQLPFGGVVYVSCAQSFCEDDSGRAVLRMYLDAASREECVPKMRNVKATIETMAPVARKRNEGLCASMSRRIQWPALPWQKKDPAGSDCNIQISEN